MFGEKNPSPNSYLIYQMFNFVIYIKRQENSCLFIMSYNANILISIVVDGKKQAKHKRSLQGLVKVLGSGQI